METVIKIAAVCVGVFLAAILWALIARDIRKAPGGAVMFYGPHLWLVTIACAVTFLIIGYFTWREGGLSSILPLSIIVALTLLCMMVLLEAAFVRITYDDYYITTRSPWRAQRRIPWHSLTGYSWSEINRWHVLDTRSQGKIRLSALLIGLPEFTMFLVEKMGVDWAVREGIIPEEHGKDHSGNGTRAKG
jgi:hypothetical protein